MSDVATYTLQMAFNELVADVFYIDTSALDGTDGLSDLGLYAGTFDDVSDDIADVMTVVFGTDSLAGAVQAGNLTCTMRNAADPERWNPNNPASPFNSATPGFVPMRPVSLTALLDGTTYPVFTGFLRHAQWNADPDVLSCEVYCEDALLWCSRVFPTIASTGPTTTGAAIGLILDAVGIATAARNLSVGDAIDDFSADGTQSALDLIAALLEAERGTVYVDPAGIVVYESRDLVQARAAATALSSQVIGQTSGIDLDLVFTRASVTKTGGVTQTFIDGAAEAQSGRADYPAIDSPYIPSDVDAGLLAADIVYDKADGRPPITIDLDNGDTGMLATILSARLLYVYAVDSAGTTGDWVLQRITHTIDPPAYHTAEALMISRPTGVFTVDGSALDGTDPLRY